MKPRNISNLTITEYRYLFDLIESIQHHSCKLTTALNNINHLDDEALQGVNDACAELDKLTQEFVKSYDRIFLETL